MKRLTFSQKLIIELKAAHGLATDYMCAKILQISTQAVYRVQNHDGQFSDENLVKIAHLLERDPAELVAQKHIETEDSHIMRQFWEGVLENAHLAAIRTTRGLQPDQVA